MKSIRIGWPMALAVCAVLLLVGSVAYAAIDAYDISWWTSDGGGAMFSTGGGYSLGGTIGQPDAGPVLSGGNYQVEGGFWGKGTSGSSGEKVYLPLVMR